MKYLLTKLTEKNIDELKKSDIDWYPDDILGKSHEYTAAFHSEADMNKALKYLGVTDYICW